MAKRTTEQHLRYAANYMAKPGNRVKQQARWLAQYAIRSGKLVRQPCEVCGADEAHAHHDDYSKPLAVRWLCKPHHQQIHRGQKRTPPPRATHCARGHELSGANLLPRKDGRQQCRKCHNDARSRRLATPSTVSLNSH